VPLRARLTLTVLANDPALLQAMAAGDAVRVQAVLRGQRVTDLLLAVTAPDGRVLGRAGDTSPGFLPGIGRAPLAMLLPREPMVRSWPTLQRRSADLSSRGCPPVGSRRCLLGTVTAGIWMDNQELQRLAASTLDADLTLAVGDVPMASTIGRLTADDRVPATDGIRRGRLAARQVVMSVQPLTQNPGERARLLVSIPATPTTAGIDSRLLAIVLLGPVVVCVVATCSARCWPGWSAAPWASWPPRPGPSPGGTSPAPRRRSAPAARSASWPGAFERMRVELGEYLTALRSSRDELARSMNRLGAVAIENVRLHAEAERLSVTDRLTGAWNYRYFSRRFEQEIERSRRFGRVLALLMLDIDHFKSVNDRFGHQRGDEVLVEFAGRVTGSVRDIDTFARYSGEEFVLILPETT
jgi:GGDEF domain-containing protein